MSSEGGRGVKEKKRHYRGINTRTVGNTIGKDQC